ncbi:hypothetical protein Clacol_007576 [Clathrus columnatus]|uniref:UDP-N-acetylglucosamine--dolichyl-phosphate N-acetylglucosaminephosphotransferase n=1 Tax=Clathrus columnatus TaxID=1419009 RepID=A0AAV5AJL9_9AGAM|nr:hypothetical protein Clacol_007576 [Clathrus columnatus]
MALQPRPTPSLLILALIPVAGTLIIRPLLTPLSMGTLHASFGFAILAFVAAIVIIPAVGDDFIKVGLKGRDLLKLRGGDILSSCDCRPESMGLICASVYILLLIHFIPFAFSSFLLHPPVEEGLAGVEFSLAQLSVYLSAILSLLIATLLGFIDDLFDIRWRHKLPIPLIAAIPLLLVYYAENGGTSVVIPKPFRQIFGNMDLCTIFIYVIGARWTWTLGGVYAAGLSYGSKELVERHLLSLYFMLPLIGVCLGFMYHNWYPARAFPGDTLCYFSGMAFAVVGIQGHFSKTLLLFFIPQIFNFVLSCPQLFGLVPCPRHRLPKFEQSTMLLRPSVTEYPHPPSKLTVLTLRVLSGLRLTRLVIQEKTNIIMTSTNLTILNFLLFNLEDLGIRLGEQGLIFCSILAFGIRYGLAGLVYDGDRR